MENWKAQNTLLIVGEGYCEVAFLNHVKQIYAPRGCGLKVTIGNARRKSPQHIIEHTVRQIKNAQYDQVAVMLDTDVACPQDAIKKANKNKIKLLKSEPCFEALMLRIIGQSSDGETKILKRRFAPFVNNEPTNRENYSQHFTVECLNNGRVNNEVINLLLTLFEQK